MKASEPTTGEMRAARLEAIQGARQYIDEIGGQGEGGTSRYDTAAHTIKKALTLLEAQEAGKVVDLSKVPEDKGFDLMFRPENKDKNKCHFYILGFCCTRLSRGIDTHPQTAVDNALKDVG